MSNTMSKLAIIEANVSRVYNAGYEAGMAIGGGITQPMERVVLIDVETSKTYKLYVANGKLSMEEVK